MHAFGALFGDERSKWAVDTGSSEPGHWLLDGGGETGLRKPAKQIAKERSLTGILMSKVNRSPHNSVGYISHDIALSRAFSGCTVNPKSQ